MVKNRPNSSKNKQVRYVIKTVNEKSKGKDAMKRPTGKPVSELVDKEAVKTVAEDKDKNKSQQKTDLETLKSSKAERKDSKKTENRAQTDKKPEIGKSTVITSVKVTEVTTETKLSRKERRQKTKQKNMRGRYPMPVFLRVLCSILFLVVMSIFFTWFIYWRTNANDAEVAWEFIREKPILAAYSCTVIFCVLATIVAITWRTFFGTGLFFCIISVLTFINEQKFNLRATPLFPEELQLADSVGDLVQFVDMEAMWRLIFGIIFVMIGSILLEYYVRKVWGRDPKKLPWWNRVALIPRVTFTMIALVVLAGVTTPVLQKTYGDWLEGIELRDWDPVWTYKNNGFVIGFLYNLKSVEVKRPDDYSEDRMTEIAKKYRDIKEADTERLAWSEKVDNIIVILAETFYDPALLTKYYDHYGGDVTPNLHRVFKEYPSGYMYSPEYGGSTANVEFEVQTGLSNYWAATVPYVNAVSKLGSLLGVANWGKNFGYATTAVHSYNGSLYKRNVVYPKIGYDIFIDEDAMQNDIHEGASGYINDKALYQEILGILEASDEPKVIGAVTMQNHSPYDSAQYQKLDFTLKNRPENWYVLESSFQSLHNSDEYLGEFLDALDELDERTVVLWFGDHAAGALDEYFLSDSKDDRDVSHLTPYFVYANFDIESPYTVKETTEINGKLGFTYPTLGVDLPTTSPNCLQNAMYNILNIEKPALFYLLDTVCEENPILTRPYLNGEKPSDTETLREYELVNYDVFGGKHYWDGK